MTETDEKLIYWYLIITSLCVTTAFVIINPMPSLIFYISFSITSPNGTNYTITVRVPTTGTEGIEVYNSSFFLSPPDYLIVNRTLRPS